MGSCISSESVAGPSANVVAITGELRLFSLPITASQALQSLNLSPNSFFICNSDRLYFDDFIPPLAHDDLLDAAQIYFVLPAARLQYRLAASDMGALAVKASLALDQIGRRKKKARISPTWTAVEDPQSNHTVNYRKSFVSDDGGSSKSSATPRVSRSTSLRKLSRYSSRRAMQAVRSFKIKLSTINEA
ncbi:uncharacterized protein LOC131009872 [Salvia miltiorrhiza]|uniref:uncharacterized protein LOC131009872 n=1 Tax=Salvia miltiorrhiza TaxID=226208 RepID=UPI0025AB7FC1|nr:uncharacterized protein LOC131009872 [Salvia miltiorrhiza]